ncbi:hypothetical protein VOLCADRAFT_87585 [Volvox carteri f. nagariensis]|uniref:Uncharacterized protein n=1 Tax=Volvox carteri f. nagariensis TaxID=3068 RepID=D8TLP8_VOLCA|nr:uncharacterized protein VOLCADRAFT_87585 [Volvox carteri f. nagariensis]EFJ51505.1 hypothetical protein VOLCADRAFT_87585 [Volvox carteri f. nagariensis]|eukprot:XP_002947457.1 hypothetical protein VOLCADRAFT_87585 [Volvox carteri f. nagariensis]
MLSGAPARACPAAIPHGGVLVPLSAYIAASTSQPCSALRAGRKRPVSELTLQFSGSRTSQQPEHMNTPTRQLSIVWAHERQPGPQEDGISPGVSDQDQHQDQHPGGNGTDPDNSASPPDPADQPGQLGRLPLRTPPPGADSGAGAVPGAPQQLPPLRLDFLDWARIQQRGPGGSGGGGAGGTGRARRQRSGSGMSSSSGSAGGGIGGSKSRSDRILQLVLAAKTLLQVRSVVSRHLHDMSPSTAAVALSRLATLSVATMRLRRAQLGLGVQGRGEPQGKGRKGEEAEQQPEVVVGNSNSSIVEGKAGVSTVTAETAAATKPPPPPSPSGRTTPAAGGAAAAAATKSADADGGADVTDPSSRVQQGSLRLMRLLLRHIATSVDSTAAGGGGGGGRSRGSGSGSGAGSTSPRWRSPTSSSSSAAGASGTPGYRAQRGGGGGGAAAGSSASSWRWQPAPPGHRARLAGSVMATLARVGLKPGPSDLWALYRLVEAARGGHLRTASPGQLCQILWAMHRLEFTPDPDWRMDCTAAVQAALTASSNGGDGGATATAASTPVATGTAGCPGEGGEQAAVAGGRGGDTSASAAAIGGGSSGGAASSLSRKGTTRGRYDRMAEQDSEDDELYDSSSSIDELDPDLEAVMDETLAGGGHGRSGGAGVALRRYGSGYADVASLLLWSVRMGMAPGATGMQACLERLHPGLRSLRRVHLLRLLLALSESGHRASEGFMNRLLACLQPKLPLLGATQLTQTLMALSRLGFVPPQSWLVAFLKASRTQLRHYTPSHVTATCQVFAGWQLRPSRTYLQSLLALMDALMPYFPAEGLAAALQSLSVLAVKPQHRWVARALEHLVAAAERNTSTPPVTGLAVSEDLAAVLYGDGGDNSGLRSSLTHQLPDATTPTTSTPGAGGPPGAESSSSLTALGTAPGRLRSTAVQGGYLPAAAAPLTAVMAAAAQAPPPPPVGGGAAAATAAGQPQQQAMRQQQRAATAAALVTAVCSLRGIVQFDSGGGRPLRTAAAADSSSSSSTASSPPMDGHLGNGSDAHAVPAAVATATVAAADGTTTLLPYELWSSTKRLTDLCGELLDVMTGSDLAQLLTALSRVNFYPGRVFLAAHARATARVGAQLAPADKEALATCYNRLAALAPRMAEEARRQAEARQARAAVVVADPWAATTATRRPLPPPRAGPRR